LNNPGKNQPMASEPENLSSRTDAAPKVTRSRFDENIELVGYAAALFLVLVFFRIAWVTEDAYIIFRSIEQFFAGNGPRWNPHERVQAFTSPLWFWYLTGFRVFSENAFMNAIMASALLFLPTLWLLRKMLRDSLKWLTALLVLVCSTGFFDYTTSGLENPLAYFLIVLFLSSYYRVFRSDGDSRNAVTTLLVVAGLLLVCRHDLATLVVPPVGYAVWRHRNSFSRAGWIRVALLAVAPLIVWSLYSVLYYGSLLPNTAYAKLSAGVPRSDLMRQGLRYIEVCLRQDTMTVVIIVGGLITALRSATRQRWIAAGVLLNLLYVVSVGGDFMLGRFLSFAFLTALVVLLSAMPSSRVHVARFALLAAAGVCVGYMFLYPHTPTNSPIGYRAKGPHLHGVADERGAYARGALWHYFKQGRPAVFPDHHWATEGFAMSRSDGLYVERIAIGYFGYWAGTDVTIVDPQALTDPLLSRLPIDARVPWRIGHYPRRMPDGYRESILNDSEEIKDPNLNEYYKKLKLITQGPLFSTTRLKTILAMNAGAYDHYLDDARARLRSGRE
jgi:arabinofuranosyltransferase